MTLPPPGQLRLICVPSAGFWRVEARRNAKWSVGILSVDLAEAIDSAQEKFKAEHMAPRPAPKAKAAPKASSTDLSDLFV